MAIDKIEIGYAGHEGEATCCVEEGAEGEAAEGSAEFNSPEETKKDE